MAKMTNWTQQQQRAISWRGSDMVVTASAGTGKTAVLSGRCVDIIADRKLCPNILSVLVLTFTDAAAEQMRARIARQLREKIEVDKNNSHLRHQLVLLDGADISTIHSFCKRAITQYFYRLAIDPTFGILDGDQQKLIKSQVLQKTIDWAWQQSNLTQGLEELFYGRDVRSSEGFLNNIIRTSDFLDTVVSKDNWLKRVLTLGGDSLLGGTLGQRQQQMVADNLKQILEQLRFAQQLYKNLAPAGQWFQACQDNFIEPVESCVKALESGNWQSCAEKIRDFKKPTVRKPKDIAEETAQTIKSIVDDAIGTFTGLCELAVLNPKYLDKMASAVGRQGRIFIELVRKFDQLYGNAKQSLNCLDFADLEHKTLELLADRDNFEQGKLEPSDTALELRKKYKYIFVDEYQDINPVQKAIIQLLSGPDNLFVVGDVKQSIYAFRGAEPKIFVEALERASADAEKDVRSLRVDLNINWRSDQRILDFVNKVFGRVMTASIGNIDYDASAMLIASEDNRPGDDSGPAVELHILDKQNKDEESGPYSVPQKQAAMIAQRIKQLVVEQPLEYRDIVILMRSPSTRVRNYVEILRLAGIPVICQEGGGYFKATEINDCLSLLKVLDNPLRDIEFAAVLRSPIFGLTDTELAKIKIHGKKTELGGGFYECAKDYSIAGPENELSEKLKGILKQIGQWRRQGRLGSLADLIWQVYKQTGYLSFVSARINGRQRRANLLKLHQKAIEFEGFAGGGATVGRFVEFIEKARDAGLDWSGAEPTGQSENAVRIMSVHKSKGLEFEVVFLAELNSQFNTSDMTGQCLLDEQNGLGLQVIDRQANARVDSLARQIIAQNKRKTMLAEEMRILYVAMTRAKRRLILSGCQSAKNCADIVRKGYFLGNGEAADWQLSRCGCHLDWLLYGLADQKNLHRAIETGIDGDSASDCLAQVMFYREDELKNLDKYIRKLRKAKPNKKIKPVKTRPDELVRQAKDSLDFEYRYGEVWKLAAKQSVTQLTHDSDEFVKRDYSDTLDKRPGRQVRMVDAKAEGTAAHLLISKLDLTNTVTKEAIEKTMGKLIAENLLTTKVADSININSIMRFFQSDIGKQVFAEDNSVWREWPFTFAVPVSGESIIVQGIVDMLIEKPDGLLIVDFKTDNVTASQAKDRAENYSRQLQLYGKAAEVILKKKVLGKWLYFLKPSCAVALK